MKKGFLTGLYGISLGMLLLISCNNNTKSKETGEMQQTQETYACPMKCSNETFTKSGQCPVCGMDLEKVNPS